jgi:hypothetical protein
MALQFCTALSHWLTAKILEKHRYEFHNPQQFCLEKTSDILIDG